jgi:hypothetical protein
LHFVANEAALPAIYPFVAADPKFGAFPGLFFADAAPNIHAVNVGMI